LTVKKLEKFLSKGENKSLFFNTIFDYYHYKLLSELCSSLREVRLSKLLEENAAIKNGTKRFLSTSVLSVLFPKTAIFYIKSAVRFCDGLSVILLNCEEKSKLLFNFNNLGMCVGGIVITLYLG
jgi:hypothetical protein